MEFFIHCRIITIQQTEVTELLTKHFVRCDTKIHVSYVCILPNVKLKNLISKTEAAPKEHHNQGMSGWGGESEGEWGGWFLWVKSEHRH